MGKAVFGGPLHTARDTSEVGLRELFSALEFKLYYRRVLSEGCYEPVWSADEKQNFIKGHIDQGRMM
jgi:hypothetical protein